MKSFFLEFIPAHDQVCVLAFTPLANERTAGNIFRYCAYVAAGHTMCYRTAGYVRRHLRASPLGKPINRD